MCIYTFIAVAVIRYQTKATAAFIGNKDDIF